MDTSPRYEKDDIVINFRDLTVHILRRWRSAVIGVLIVTLLAGVFGHLKDQRSYEASLAAEKDKVATVQLDELSLANANQVLQYQKLYEQQAEYNRESLLMQIDTGAVNTRTLSYLVTGAKSYVTAAMYQTHLSSLTMYEDIAAAVAPNSNPSHIMELVTVSLQYDSGADAVADHAMINIRIIAPTKELCAAIALPIKQQMQTLRPTVTSALDSHSLTLAADTVQLITDNSLKSTQQNNLNNCNTLRNNLKSAKDALTSDEKAYVEQMTAIDKVDDADTAELTPPSINVKMLILGFAAGLVLMVGLHALGYVFSRKLKSREDFAERYGLFVFGCLCDDEEKRVSLTERLIRRLFFKKERVLSAQDRLALAQQQITLTLRGTVEGKANAAVFVIGSTLDDNTAALFAPFKEAAAKNGATLDVLRDPLTDAAALERLATADAVILAETLGASAYDDIYRELELCERLNRPVLGAFLMK